jgi:hypothetical protein
MENHPNQSTQRVRDSSNRLSMAEPNLDGFFDQPFNLREYVIVNLS